VIKEKLFLAESLVATIIGICFGPMGAKAIDPFVDGNIQATNYSFSDIVICIQIMAAAISLPKKFWLRRWKSIGILLGPVVIYKWLIGALIFYGVLGRPFTEALILSGCTAPTDPILANSITSGRFADMHIPVSIRQLLSAESAANDGIVLPLWALSVYLYKYNIGEAFAKWGYMILAYEMILSIIFGVIIGLSSRWALYYSEREGWIDKKNFFSFEIALTLFVVGVAQILNLSTFISVFVTGLVFSWDGWFAAETEEAHVQEVIDNLLNLTYFVYFGNIIFCLS
jgi:NhaP-type Na+/H+ or K+/H+ antiporter